MDGFDEAKEWYRELLAREVLKSLQKNNITGLYVETKEQAREKVLGLIPRESRVGHGGSLSLHQLGIIDALRSGDYHFIDHKRPGIAPEEMYALQRESLLADVFVSSTNALTIDGKLVSIDGTGNRVAALIFGPRKVIVVAGVNKIVPDVEAARQRIKDYVAPLHARRRGWDLPCAKTGKCVDCRAPRRICNAEVVIQYQRDRDRMTVIIVGEELGI